MGCDHTIRASEQAANDDAVIETHSLGSKPANILASSTHAFNNPSRKVARGPTGSGAATSW